jgi:hypothetical protein
MVAVVAATVTVVAAPSIAVLVEYVVDGIKGFNCCTGLIGLFSENFPGALSVTDIYHKYCLMPEVSSKQ